MINLSKYRNTLLSVSTLSILIVFVLSLWDIEFRIQNAKLEIIKIKRKLMEINIIVQNFDKSKISNDILLDTVKVNNFYSNRIIYPSILNSQRQLLHNTNDSLSTTQKEININNNVLTSIDINKSFQMEENDVSTSGKRKVNSFSDSVRISKSTISKNVDFVIRKKKAKEDILFIRFHSIPKVKREEITSELECFAIPCKYYSYFMEIVTKKIFLKSGIIEHTTNIDYKNYNSYSCNLDSNIIVSEAKFYWDDNSISSLNNCIGEDKYFIMEKSSILRPINQLRYNIDASNDFKNETEFTTFKRKLNYFYNLMNDISQIKNCKLPE